MASDEQIEDSSDSEQAASSGEKMASGGSKLFGGIAIIALLVAAVAWFFGKSGNKMPPKAPGDHQDQSENAGESASYTDGDYTAVGNYVSPAGPEQITVTLSLEKGIVTKVSSTEESSNPKSQYMQKQFAEGISSAVTGKPIDSLNLTVVNGSSLTPKGFMDALQKIKEEAKG